MPITPEQARAELARRELAKREQPVQPQQPVKPLPSAFRGASAGMTTSYDPNEPVITGGQAVGALARGEMTAAGALLKAPSVAVKQWGLLNQWSWAERVLSEKDPEKQKSFQRQMFQAKQTTDKVADWLGESAQLHKQGVETILKNHPEWASEPPKSFVDLVTNPVKLGVAMTEAIPLLANATILTVAGQPNMAAGLMYVTEGQSAYDQAKQDKASEEDAVAAYGLYGSVSAALETMQIQGLIKIAKGSYNTLLNRTAQKLVKGGKALTYDTIKAAATQSFQEMSQGMAGESVAKSVYGKEIQGGLTGFVDRRAQEATVAAALSVIPGVAGGVAAKVRGQPVSEAGVSQVIRPGEEPTQQINVYKTVSGSRTGITEQEVTREGERYVDSVTGEDVVLDQAASGSAIERPAVEKIRAAAYYNPNTGEISEGLTHVHAAANMKEMFPVIKEGKPMPKSIQEGFVTTTGRFITNEQAEELAKKAGQLPKGYKLTQEERILGRPTAQNILKPVEPAPAQPPAALPMPETVALKTPTPEERQNTFIDSLTKSGFNVADQEESISFGKNTFTTFVSSDKNVRIAVDSAPIHIQGGEVILGKSGTGKPDELTIQGLVVEPEKRGIGLARQAMIELQQAADKSGLTLLGEPTQITKYIGKGKPALTREQLINWYKKLGWTQRVEGSDLILEYKPTTKTTALKTPTPEEELETEEEAGVAEKELEVEEYQEVEPELYIGNVTAGMKKRMTKGTELKPEDVKGFTEKGWPTKRTKVKVTKGEAEQYLEWLENDLKRRLDENKINTRKDMWMANADWGDIKTLRNVLGLDPVARPFKIIPSQEEGIVYRDRGEIEALKEEIRELRKQLVSLTLEQVTERDTVKSEILEKKQLVTQLEKAKDKAVKIVKDTRSAIYGAVEPSRLQESKMTVGEVLRAVLRRSERYARMAYIGGRKELRVTLRAKARAKKRLDAALKVIKQDIPKSVDIVYRDAIDTIRGQIDPSFRSEAATKRLESLRDFVKRNPEQAKNIPVALLKSLEQTPLNDYTIEQIEALATSIQKLKDLGGLRRRLETAEYERSKQKDLKKLSEGSVHITDRDMVKASEIGKKLDFTDRLKNKLSRVLNIAAQKKRAITPTDVLVDLMDGGHGTYDGPNYTVFKRTLDRGWGRYLDRLDATVKEVIEFINKSGFDDGNFERIGVHAALQQDNGKQKLLDSGYTEERINQVVLTPEELQLYTLIRSKLDELTDPIDTIMRNVFNEKLERVKNYFSFMTDFEAMSDYELRDMFSDKLIEYPDTLKKEVKKGFTITRTGGKQKIKINAVEIFLQHVDNASYLIELGSDIKRLQEIASTSTYRDAVGDAGQEEMRSWLDLMARKGLVGQDKTIPVLDIYRKHVGAAVIGFKLSSALVNTTPLLDGAGLIGRYAFTGASAVTTNRQLREFLIKNFPEVKHRMGGDIEFLEFGSSTVEKIERAGFWALQKIDGIANASIVAGAYQKYLDEHGLTFDVNKVNEDARDYAQLIARRTQSSAFFKDLPSAFTRGTFTGNKSIDRLAFQFQSFMLNRWSLIEHDMLRAGIKERDVGKLTNMFFWLSMAGFAEMGLRRLSKELIALITGRELDDWSETFTEEIITNMFQNIPFVSQAMSIYSYGSIPVPSIALANEIVNKIKWLRKTNDPDKKLLMGLELLALTIGTAIGVPGTIQLAEVLRSVGKDDESGGSSRRPPTRPPARRPPTRPSARRPPTRRPG